MVPRTSPRPSLPLSQLRHDPAQRVLPSPDELHAQAQAAIDQRDWSELARLLMLAPPGEAHGQPVLRLTGFGAHEVAAFIDALPPDVQVPVLVLDRCEIFGIPVELEQLTAHPGLQGLCIENTRLAPSVDALHMLDEVWARLAAGAERRHLAGEGGLKVLAWTGTSVDPDEPTDTTAPTGDAHFVGIYGVEGLPDLIRCSPDLVELSLSGMPSPVLVLDMTLALQHLPAASSLERLTLTDCTAFSFGADPQGALPWNSFGNRLTHLELGRWTLPDLVRPHQGPHVDLALALSARLQPALCNAPAGLRIVVNDMHKAGDLGWLLASILGPRVAPTDVCWISSTEDDTSYRSFCEQFQVQVACFQSAPSPLGLDLALQGPGSRPAETLYAMTAGLLQHPKVDVRAFNLPGSAPDAQPNRLSIRPGRLHLAIGPLEGDHPDDLAPQGRRSFQRLITAQVAMQAGFPLGADRFIPADMAVQLHARMVDQPGGDPGRDTWSLMATSTHSYRSWVAAQKQAMTLPDPAIRRLAGTWAPLSPVQDATSEV